MLPDLPKEKFMFLGNTCQLPEFTLPSSEKLRREAEEIAHKMTYMELCLFPRNFMHEYMSALFLPHTDIGLFPTVAKLLKTG